MASKHKIRRWERWTHHVPSIIIESLGFERLFFAFEGFELVCDVGVNEIGNVLAIHDFWNDVILPLVVREDVILCPRQIWSAGRNTNDNAIRTFEVDVVYSRTAVLQLDIPFKLPPFRVIFVVLLE